MMIAVVKTFFFKYITYNHLIISSEKVAVERYDDSWNTDDEDWDYTDNEDESSKDSGISIKKRKTHNTVDDGDKNIYLQRLQEWQDTRNEAAELDYEELEGGMRVPASLWTSLYHYQKVAVQWLWELHQQDVGGILGVCNYTV